MERKEAIEVIKKNWPDSSSTMLREALETVILELKESEDERIRKRLMEWVEEFRKLNPTNADHNAECSEAIAWLENQGEQKSIEMKSAEESLSISSEIYNKIVDDCVYELEEQKPVEWNEKDEKMRTRCAAFLGYHYQGGMMTRKEYKEAHNWLESLKDRVQQKQGEQNPVDKKPKFKVGQTIKKEDFNLGFTIVKIEDGFYYNDKGDYFPFTDQDNWELVEQKSAWSEEDENHVKSILSTIECCKAQFPNAQAVVEAYNADIEWLKSLKDRVQPQPKQEWSEEDEKKIGDIRDAITLDNELEESYKEELYDFLKSLRPQNGWKPSDEQIRVVNRLRHCFLSDVSGNDIVILDALLEQLKKL